MGCVGVGVGEGVVGMGRGGGCGGGGGLQESHISRTLNKSTLYSLPEQVS